MADEIIHARVKLDGVFEIEVNASKIETVKTMIKDLKKEHIEPLLNVNPGTPQGQQQPQQQFAQYPQQHFAPQAPVPSNAPPLNAQAQYYRI